MQAVCPAEEITPESGKEVLVEEEGQRRYIALFRKDDEVRAYLNSCPHQGRSLNWAPDQFLLDPEGRLICPHHGACFELDSGECVSGPCVGAMLTPVAIKIIDGTIFLA